MTEEINIQRYGMNCTGAEDYYSPRREYALNEVGKQLISAFFNIEIKDKKIWLTPKTIDDLLIFNAFVEGFNYVIANYDDDITTLYATDEDQAVKNSLNTASGVYVNPKLFLPSH